MDMSQEVTDFINNIQVAWQADVANRLHQTVLGVVPDLTQRIQYSKPHYLKNKKYLAVISTAKAFVSFTIFNAQNLDTPPKLFETSENGDRKTIKIREGQQVDYDMLGRLVTQAASSL
jgi:hypothetical protein